MYFYAIFAAFSFVVLFVNHAPLLQDYPDWVYQGVLFSHTLIGQSDSEYIFHTYPVPNSFSTVGLGLLDLLFGWQLAAKVWLVALFVLAAFSIRSLIAELGTNQSWIQSISPTLVLLNMTFWTGNVNFQFAVAFALLWVLQLLRTKQQRPVDIVALAGTLLLLFFCHMVICAAAAMILVAFVHETRRYKLLVAMIPAGLLVIWYKVGLVLQPAGIDTQLDTPVKYGTLDFAIYKANAYFKALGCVNVLDVTQKASISLRALGRTGFLLMLAMYGLFGSAFGLVIVQEFWKRFQHTEPDGDRNLVFLWNAIAVLLTVSAFLPAYLFGVFNPGYRCLQFALAIAAFIVQSPTNTLSKAAWVIAMAGGLISGVLNLVQFAVVQTNPLLAGTLDAHLPPRLVLQATWVQPSMRQTYYEALVHQRLNLPIFTTGLYEKRDNLPR